MTRTTSRRGGCVVAALAIVFLTAPSASANYIAGGSKTCGPDQQVRIGATTDGGTSLIDWITSSGQLKQSSKTGTSFSVYTGSRSITHWEVINNDTRVNTAGVSCV